MGLAQLELETARNKIEVAVDRLKEYGSGDRCWLAFGGGKDSVVIYDLAERAGIDFETHYAQTGIDPPELVRFIRDNYPDVIFEKPLMTMWQGIELKGLPHRHKRWCCEKLKHHCGKDWARITGIRWAESPMRRRYKIYNQMKRGTELCPIIDWSTNEVWEYIKLRNLPYCILYDEGFSRLGCMICPLASTPNRKREATRYPKVAEAYKRANRRHFVRNELGSEKDADDYFIQWMGFEVESNIEL